MSRDDTPVDTIILLTLLALDNTPRSLAGIQLLEIGLVDRRAAALQEVDDGLARPTLYSGVLLTSTMDIPVHLVKLWTALEETEHVRGEEWTLWFLGAVGNSKTIERRCGLAPSDSVDNARRQAVEAVELERLQA